MFCIMSIMNLISRLFAEINYFFSGRRESGISIKSFDLDSHATVTDPLIGKKILDRTKAEISERYSVSVSNPVVLELIKNRNSFALGFEWREEDVGKYHSQKMINEKYHMIYIISGLPRKRFIAIAAHELMHAFLYEKRLFTESQPVREAMARWMEYKMLKSLGDKGNAEKLMGIKTLKFGKGFKSVLNAEKKLKGGIRLTEWLLNNRDEAERLKKEILEQ